MGFFQGRVTCCRFKVSKAAPRQFGPEHLEKLADAAIGKQRIATADGTQVGWIAGDHILDTRFDLEKNVIADTLQFAMRVDEVRIPSDLLRAYYAVELEALASQNPSGLPSGRQKREARQVAKDRLEQEAKDGRFLKRRATSILWDSLSNELLVATSSSAVLDRLHVLFKQTFERNLDFLGAGRQAFLWAEVDSKTRAVDDAAPTVFVSGQKEEIAWDLDEASRDYLGNEFLLWLWFHVENESDTIKLSDDSEVAVMLARTLVLEWVSRQQASMAGKASPATAPGNLPEAAASPARSEGASARQGRADAASPRQPLRAVAAGGDARDLLGEDAAVGGRDGTRPPRGAGLAAAASARDGRPAVRRVPVAPDLRRLEGGVGPHQEVAREVMIGGAERRGPPVSIRIRAQETGSLRRSARRSRLHVHELRRSGRQVDDQESLRIGPVERPRIDDARPAPSDALRADVRVAVEAR